MKTAYKFRLYPRPEQQRILSQMLESARRLWNVALNHRKQRYETLRLSTSLNLQRKLLTEEKWNDSEFSVLYSQVAQDVLLRLDRAFQTFFRRFQERKRGKQLGYPQFKKYLQSGSITYPQAYNGSVKVGVHEVYVSKVGTIPMVLHRQLPLVAKLKTCTILREPDLTWWASFSYDDGLVPTGTFWRLLEQNVKNPIGIDFGLNSLISDTSERKIEPPEFLRRAEKRLKRLQRSLSRKQKASKNREMARFLVARQHAKVRRQRLDFVHKTTTRLVREHDMIVDEDLEIRNMVKNHKLAKSILDASWGIISRCAEYKSEREGKIFVRVDPAYTTQECSICGFRSRIDISVREFKCDGCGRVWDRDFNAPRTILQRGFKKVGLDRSELKPVETEPLQLEPFQLQAPINEAGTCPKPTPSTGGGRI